MSESELRAKLAQITHRAWIDDKFRAALCNNCEEAIEEYSLPIRKEVKIQFHIDTPETKNFSIPLKPETIPTDQGLNLKEKILSMSRLHAEVACTTNWVVKK